MFSILLRVVPAALLAGGIVLLVPSTAFACSCVTPDVGMHARAADVVLVGTVVDREGPPWWRLIRSSGDPVTYRMTVDRVFKGRVGTVVRVESAGSRASCGIDVDLGNEYVVYADRSGSGDLTASLCGGTTEADATAQAAVERHLGRSMPPDPSITASGPRYALLWPVAGAALAVGAVFASALGLRALQRR